MEIGIWMPPLDSVGAVSLTCWSKSQRGPIGAELLLFVIAFEVDDVDWGVVGLLDTGVAFNGLDT